MKRSIRKYEYTCDGCQKTVVVERLEFHDELPEGWRRVQVHNCGMTNYTRKDDLCAECFAKR